MTNSDCYQRAYPLFVTAGINQRYHQSLAGRWSRWDKGTRIAVCLLSVAGLLTVFSNSFGWSLAVALPSLVAAVVLNIFQFGEWACVHAGHFKGWTYQRRRASKFLLLMEKRDGDSEVSPDAMEQLKELIDSEESLNQEEPVSKNKELLESSYGDELESIWGRGIRTEDAAEVERERRLTYSVVSQGAADEAVEAVAAQG